MVSIILVSYNKGEVTKACVESLHKNLSIPYEIIVVDNGSRADTLDMLEALEGIRLFKSPKNLGFPAGCNKGLDMAKGELIWFLNNDTLVPPGSLERMVELLLSEETIGMVGPVTNRISGRQEIPVDYATKEGVAGLADVEAFAERNAIGQAGQVWRMIRLVGFSMLLRKSTLDTLGGLEERMGIGTFEDDELCLRLVANGYRLLIARDAFIHHIGSASFKAAGGYPPGGEHNQIVASTSAGMTVPDETVLNETLLPLLRKEAGRVIHVGCGAGAYGLTAAESGVYAVGFERDARRAAIAQNHYARFECYQPGQPFAFEEDGFDAVMIENQCDSAETLCLIRSLRAALVPGAQVLLQLPKITNIQVQTYNACLEGWNEWGYYPIRGRFELVDFLKAMLEDGFWLKSFDEQEQRHGFFNRNAFVRQGENAPLREGQLNFFHYANFVFEYMGRCDG